MTTPLTTSSSYTASATATASAADARFSCNICLDAVSEPVVTQCGHLYCWPCLFRWLEPGMLPSERQSLGIPSTVTAAFTSGAIDETRRVCPVCKAPCSVPSLVPVYVRTHIDDDAPSSAGEEKEGREAMPVSTDATTATPPQTPTPPVDTGSDTTPHDSTISNEAEAGSNHGTGLRQRRGARREENAVLSGNSAEPVVSTPVPARPPANSPTRTPSYATSSASTSTSPYPASTSAAPAAAPPRSAVAMTPNNNTTLAAAMVPRVQPAPFYPGGNSGLARTVQQALIAAVEQNQRQQRTGGASDAYLRFSSGAIPPLHRREGHGNAAAAAAAAAAASSSSSSSFLQPDSLGDPDATEFLSRILLLLGSFVILCLLLF